ncbi:hypothetical protein D0T25_27270 [Duganella sp. BJB488]|uniref:hypothetical protein n=1 Tax=unclassified Duganella TaxID=2636909 RepID=UPI000E351142|nr:MULTISPECIES: hypothetical protein [unclassified Duganella]NVD74760.1 hypothetical protein [Duganella sp. BJB1802]RFP10972.1 hypothetical protein D0T26_26025 [Duganella sp. BJB489]RFP14479.1 hypothetical protein D0T25_27270 [Duganella sp. BJB488]RFP30415.1 hypothetical protein D0T24_27970 [Duganella sp. BJB480]
MKTSRSTRLVTAIVTLLSMLYMQLAVAAYVCPGVPAGSLDNAVSARAAVMMQNCQGMDAEQPQLCDLHAHGEPAKQPLDNASLADVPAFVPSALIFELPPVDPALDSNAAAYRPIVWARTVAPPVAIRNCCFRI